QKEDTVELLQAVTGLVYAIEPVFFEIGSTERKGSTYCCPMDSLNVDALTALFEFAGGHIDQSNFGQRVRVSDRYYGYNLNALSKYGTVEFRYFPAPDPGKPGEAQLRRWISFCMAVKKAAMRYVADSPRVSLYKFLAEEPSHVVTFLNRYMEEWQSLILQSLSPEIISGRAAELDALAVRSQQTVATTNVYALRFFKKKGYQSYTFREPGAEEVANDTEITEPQPVDWYRWLTPDQ